MSSTADDGSGISSWLRDDADFQDHQRENNIPMLPAAEDAPHLRAAADLIDSLESKLEECEAALRSFDVGRESSYWEQSIQQERDTLSRRLASIREIYCLLYSPDGAHEEYRSVVMQCRRIIEASFPDMLEVAEMKRAVEIPVTKYATPHAVGCAGPRVNTAGRCENCGNLVLSE